MPDNNSDIVEAVRDLTRVIIALQGDFGSRSEAIRMLDDVGIRPSSLASIFEMPTKDVASVLNKAKKSPNKGA